MPGKYDCGICKKTANTCPSNKTGSVKCNTCELWWHPPCVGVDNAVLDLIQKCLDLNMASPWSCSVCSTVWTKINKEVKQVASKAAANEARIEVLEISGEKLKDENSDMRQTIRKLEERVNKVELEKSENSSEKLMEEIAERGSRERNVVCHNCPESDSRDKNEAEDD